MIMLNLFFTLSFKTKSIAILLFIAAGCTQMKQVAIEGPSLKTKKPYKTRFDFVAGEKLLWQENFATTAIGDFPKGWNTNAGAEVVNEKGKEEKSLLLSKDGVYIPLAVQQLPENFTLEFNLSCSANFSYYSSPLDIMFASLSSKKEYTVLKQYNPNTKDVVKLWLHPHNAASNAGYSGYQFFEKGIKQTENEINTPQFFAQGGPASVKVSIWRQKERVRVYLNDDKVWDLSEGFGETIKYNSIVFGIHHITDPTGKYFISNIKLATTVEDNK